jgi:hypothetical protein
LGGAAVNVRFGLGDFDLPRDELMVWISTAAAFPSRLPQSR